jgi:predicted negative regulator of RcsB-dependent stress response
MTSRNKNLVERKTRIDLIVISVLALTFVIGIGYWAYTDQSNNKSLSNTLEQQFKSLQDKNK